MISGTAHPQITRMVELYQSCLILNEFHVHVHNFHLMHFLQEVTYLVALLEAESLRVIHLKTVVIVTELLEVIVVLALELSVHSLTMLFLLG